MRPHRAWLTVIGVVLLLPGLAASAEEVVEVWRSTLGTPYCIAVDSVDGSVWIGMERSVVHLARDGSLLKQINGYWWPRGVALDPFDRSVWVSDTYNDQVVHLDRAGRELLRQGSFWHPTTIAVNPVDRSVWVADALKGHVVHLRRDGRELSRTTGFRFEDWILQVLTVDPRDGSCLVVDYGNRRVVRLAAYGRIVWEWTADATGCPWSIALDPRDSSFWVSGTSANQTSHFSRDGTELLRLSLADESLLAVDPVDGSLWVGGGVLTRWSPDGTWLAGTDDVGGLPAVDPSDRSCWVVSRGYRQVGHVTMDGRLLLRIATPPEMRWAAAYEADGSCWVASSSEVALLAPDGSELWRRRASVWVEDLAVDPRDGSAWVAQASYIAALVHLSRAGDELLRVSAELGAPSLAINPHDGSLWVVDRYLLLHLADDGRELYRKELPDTKRVCLDPTDGSVWVTSWSLGAVHVSAEGEVLSEGVFSEVWAVDPRDGSCCATSPAWTGLRHCTRDGVPVGALLERNDVLGVEVNPLNGSAWVAVSDGLRMLHLAPDGTVLYDQPGLAGVAAVAPRQSSVWVLEDSQIVRLRVPWFADLPLDHWAGDEIGACLVAGIVSGYPDCSHQPGLSVSRDQMAVYIARALAGGDAYVPTTAAQVTFPDVPADHWAWRYIEYAAAADVVEGKPDGLYHPAELVDRAQMAVFLARATADPRGEAGVPDPPCTGPVFPDVPCEFWARKHIAFLATQGVVSGLPDGKYHPERVVTRDQMAVYMARAFQLGP